MKIQAFFDETTPTLTYVVHDRSVSTYIDVQNLEIPFVIDTHAPVDLRRGFAGFVAVAAPFILVREADARVSSAREAVAASPPQLVFALLVLGVGIAAGRATRSGRSDPFADRAFSEGAGI